MTSEQDKAYEVRGVPRRAENAPSIGGLVDGARIGGSLDEVRFSYGLEPNDGSVRKEHLTIRKDNADSGTWMVDEEANYSTCHKLLSS